MAEYEQIAISELKPYEKNARTHSDEQIATIINSIREFGFRNPVIIDENNMILAGHGRVMAAERMGLTSVPFVRWEDMTETQKRGFILADNKTADLAGWDLDLLQEELEEIDLDMADFGFDIEVPDIDITVTEDEPPAAPDEPKTKTGDLFQLGKHRLICGDSTDADTLARLMDGERADISITSPPYGAAKSSKIRQHYVPKKQTDASFYNQYEDDISEWGGLMRQSILRMFENSAAQFINIQMLADNKSELCRIIADNADNLVDVMIWDKQKAPPQMKKNILNNQYEFVFIFGGEKRTVPFGDFHGSINNVISIPTGNNEYAGIHRAVYPVAFVAEILKIASNAKSVLDIFGGTGTTMIACEQMSRKCFMSELDPAYCDVIIERWENFTGSKAVKIND